jgi:hypothetical protein
VQAHIRLRHGHPIVYAWVFSGYDDGMDRKQWIGLAIGGMLLMGFVIAILWAMQETGYYSHADPEKYGAIRR